MDYRITLDGQDLGDPQEWQSGTYEVGWDEDVFFATGGGSMNFYGDAYEYIKSVYDSSYCATIETKVYHCDEVIHQGLIFVSEAVFDLVRCVVNVAVSDNGYIAKIKNKAEQKYYLDVGTAGDGSTSITTASSVQIAMHTVSTGASVANRECYRIDEALGFLVRAVSNDTMAYTSDFFGSGGDGYNYVLVTGLELRSPGSNPAPYVSWKSLWRDLKALFNLRAAVEDVGGTQTIRVEPYVYWRGGEVSAQFKNLNNLTERVDAEKIYSTVECGSPKYRQSTDDTPNTNYGNNLIITWDKVVYNVRGDCVTDNTLDLTVKDLVIDSNSIENAINGDETNDREVFIIESDGTDSVQHNSLGDGNAFYNQTLNNNTVLSRWASRIHNDSFAEAGGASANFEALTSTESVDLTPDYDNEVSDPGGNYDDTTTPGLYNIPSDGLYLFEAYFDLTHEYVNSTFISAEFVCNLWRTDGVTAEIAATATRAIPNPDSSGTTTSSRDLEFSFYFAVEAAAGDDYFLLSFAPAMATSEVNLTYKVGCAFRGGVALVASDAVPIIQSTENMVIDPSDYRSLSVEPSQRLLLNDTKGYIQRVSYVPMGLSSIEIEFTR